MSLEDNPVDDRYQLNQCIDEIKSLQSQIATLTAERDEARKDLEQVRVQCAACLTAAEGHTPTPPLKQGDWAWTPAYQQTWELRQKYDALKSAPAMAEVDALRLEIFEWLRVVKRNLPPSQRLEVDSRELTDSIGRLDAFARRSIASREEVVGLLDHILSCIITVKQENTPEWMEWIVEEVNKVNEAIGDPDRVALSLGSIVIVKGK